jgi:hypothetical protein
MEYEVDSTHLAPAPIFPMLTDKIKELAKLQSTIAKLAASVAEQRRSELATLPAQYGYDSLPAFIAALKEAAGTAPKSKRGRPAKAATPAKPKKQKRAHITPEIKAQVKALIEAGRSPCDLWGLATRPRRYLEPGKRWRRPEDRKSKKKPVPNRPRTLTSGRDVRLLRWRRGSPAPPSLFLAEPGAGSRPLVECPATPGGKGDFAICGL